MHGNNITFTKQFRGYDEGEVNRYISRLTGEYNNVAKHSAALESEIERLTVANNDLADRYAKLESDSEDSRKKPVATEKSDTSAQNASMQIIGQTLVDAEAYAANKAAIADAEAQRIIHKAQRDADQIRLQAENELRKVYAKRGEVLDNLHKMIGSILTEEQNSNQKPAKISVLNDADEYTDMANIYQFKSVSGNP